MKPFFDNDKDIVIQDIFKKRNIKKLQNIDNKVSNQLLMLVKKQKWNDALVVSKNNMESLDLLLELFVAYQPPLEYVEEIVALGASFNDYAVFDLILLEKKNSLLRYNELGLDLLVTPSNGYNALHFAILNESSLELIEYLYQNGVPFAKDNRGYTPKEYLLKNMKNPTYAKKIYTYFNNMGY